MSGAQTFSRLAGIAEKHGLRLMKAGKGSRYGAMPVRYLLRDRHGWVYLRSLADAAQRIRSKIEGAV